MMESWPYDLRKKFWWRKDSCSDLVSNM